MYYGFDRQLGYFQLGTLTYKPNINVLYMFLMNAWVHAKWLQSYPTLCNPMSMGFSRQEYWRGLPYSPLGDTPNPGIEPGFPVVEANSLPLAEAQNSYRHLHN